MDPEEVRRFAEELKRFNADLQNRMASLQARFASLGDTWQDQEHLKFSEEFKQTLKALKKMDLPELNDEFASQVSEGLTVEKLRDLVRARLQEERAKDPGKGGCLEFAANLVVRNIAVVRSRPAAEFATERR